jgi:hypothetical protein
MLKHIVAIIVVSIGTVMAMLYLQQGLQMLLSVHDWIAQVLAQVFSGGQAGSITKNLIALLAAPIIIALVPAIIYWIIKRSWFPYFMQIVWVIWLMQTAALAILFNTTAA